MQRSIHRHPGKPLRRLTCCALFALTLIGPVMAAVPVNARARVSPDISRAIERAPSAVVNRAAIEALAIPPAATVVPADVANIVVIPPALTPAAAAVSDEAPAAPTPPANFNILRYGQLLRVRVNKAQEAAIVEAVKVQVKEEAGSGTVVPMPDVYRVQSVEKQELQLKSYALVGQPLVYQLAEQNFKGNIQVGVTALNDYTGSRELSTPVQFAVLETAMANPANISVTRVGQPLMPISITANPVGNSVSVHVSTDDNIQGVELKLPVSPTLIVRPESATMQGYGVEALRVHLQLLGVDNPDKREVQVSADPGAYFDSPKLVLDANGSGSVMMRAKGAGPMRVIASLGAMSSLGGQLSALQPIETLTWSLGGGLLGGLVRLLTRKGQRPGTSRALLALLTSVLIGFFVLLLYIAGIRLMAYYPTTSATNIAVAAVSALAAFLGARSLASAGGAPKK